MAAEGAGFTVKHRDEFDRAWERWLLVRRGLGVSSFGVNIVEVEPGGSLTEHDEVERDQEELFVFLSGEATMVIDGHDIPAPAGTYVRVAPAARRSARNDGATVAELLIISAPTTSGFEPMDWS
jgi:mannose-6-phosphate isomerase-like protein (cupin superfamily)